MIHIVQRSSTLRSSNCYSINNNIEVKPSDSNCWSFFPAFDTYDTKYKICDNNEIGDEFHYLFICPVFQEDRNRLLKEYYRKIPSMFKIIELMSTTNMTDLRKLAEFATIIIRKFQ